MERAADLPLRKFSRGMLQRVGLAQALINDPALVILDEPLGGLDPLGRKEIRDIILGLRDEGKTVVFTSHILQDIEMICDRVAIIVGGRILSQGRLVGPRLGEDPLHRDHGLRASPEAELAALRRVRLEPRAAGSCSRSTTRPGVEAVLEPRPGPQGPASIRSCPRTQTLEDIFVDMVKPT